MDEPSEQENPEQSHDSKNGYPDDIQLTELPSVNDAIASTLRRDGLSTVGDLRDADLDRLTDLEGLNEPIARKLFKEIQSHAKSAEPDPGEQIPDKRRVNPNERPEETLDRLRELSRQGGPEEKIQQQKDRGQKTAWERIKYLFDADSFQPIDSLVERREFSNESPRKHMPGDGVITGFGEINGRRVACYSQDFTVFGGSLSEEHGQKICKLLDLAHRHKLPVIGLNDSGGARIQDGVRSLGSYAEIFHKNSQYSGEIPQISLIMGPCAGGAVYSPALSDLLFMVEETSFMYLTGPDVVQTVTGEKLSHRDLGGTDVHDQNSGVTHRIGPDEQRTMDLAVQALSYLPDHYGEKPDTKQTRPPSESTSLEDLVPEDKTKPYDVRKVIDGLVDEDSFFELQPQFARNLVVGFARLGGISLGLVANQPKYNAGTLDIDASDKAARFVRLCDNYNLPILTLQDVPGFLPGKSEEAAGIIRHGAKLLYAYARAKVPLVTLITRKSYGGAYCVMASKQIGADFNFAWPMAELAVMGPESAVEILHGEEINRADDSHATREEKLQELRERFGNPWQAARRGYLDDVIKPTETRSRLMDALDIVSRQLPVQRNNPPGNPPV